MGVMMISSLLRLRKRREELPRGSARTLCMISHLALELCYDLMCTKIKLSC